MNKIFFALMLALIIIPFVSSAPPESPQTNTCVAEEIRITELIQNNSNLSKQVIYFSNLSDYYEESYLSQEVNLTNRELISLTQYISILNQNVTDLSTQIGELKQEVTFFNLTFKLTLSLLTLTILGALIKKINFKKIKEWKIKQSTTHVNTKIFLNQ